MKDNSNRKGMLIHIRTYRVEVVYAWAGNEATDVRGLWWWTRGGGTSFDRKHRAIFADPLGKHSRKRARAAALAAKPAGPSVLVAIRRRVKEV